ncbi:hypothetical protein SADUNF_Sadunf19G0094700 [Salix dunnii]|uniref:BZIP domain-containing protein n=1 Tax=Salix dunnii TaxID=1413687 RepID=A0A835J447_9ROSI|nr:hypothetical protein SADUNF_Sadunf19G0094700 [Salix dunnii]
MSTRAQTELDTKEMKKLKKRETDRRYRQNKKKAVQETENKLAMTITENENLKRAVEELRQENFHLTSQRQLIQQRFDTIYTELEKEIECVCAAAEGFGEQRGMTLGAGNSQQPFHVVTRFSN